MARLKDRWTDELVQAHDEAVLEDALRTEAKRAGAALAKPRNRSVVPDKYKVRYGKAGNCGDAFALALAEAAPTEGNQAEALRELATLNGVDFSRWDHCNIGQRRMNLGNVLRGKFRRGEPVRIGGQTFHQPKLAEAA